MAEYTEEEVAELERLAAEEMAQQQSANGAAAGLDLVPTSGPRDPGEARRSTPVTRGLALAEGEVVARELGEVRQQLRELHRDLSHCMHLVIVMAERWKISGEELAAAYEATRRAREEARRAPRS